MSANTRIPFGVKVESGVIVSARQVNNGRACGCICDSCGLPLIAKQGERVQWHFAHDTRTDSTTSHDTPCEYSLFVTLRKLIKQELCRDTRTLELNLPSFQIRRCDPIAVNPKRLSESRAVSNGGVFTLTDIQVDQQLEDVRLDILGKIGGYPFALQINCPDRLSTTRAHYSHPYGCSGVVAIDIGVLETWIAESEHPVEELMQFVQTDRGSKLWLYHHNESSVRAKLYTEYEERLNKEREASAEMRRMSVPDNSDTLMRTLKQQQEERARGGSSTVRGTNRSKVRKGSQRRRCLACGTFFPWFPSHIKPACPRCRKCQSKLVREPY